VLQLGGGLLLGARILSGAPILHIMHWPLLCLSHTLCVGGAFFLRCAKLITSGYLEQRFSLNEQELETIHFAVATRLEKARELGYDTKLDDDRTKAVYQLRGFFYTPRVYQVTHEKTA
tara:strand:- start:188 stop:541 length:354 start_codon:yes stop_codon:yes gene_type:complete